MAMVGQMDLTGLTVRGHPAEDQAGHRPEEVDLVTLQDLRGQEGHLKGRLVESHREDQTETEVAVVAHRRRRRRLGVAEVQPTRLTTRLRPMAEAARSRMIP